MMRMWKRVAAGLLCGAMFVSLAACSGSGSSGGSSDGNTESYTMWIYNGVSSAYYVDYAENPVVEYAQTKTYGPENKKVDIEFWIPPEQKQADNLQLMMTGNSLPDILDGCIADTATNLYEDQYIIDLTDYIEQYMPNYKKFLDEHEDFRKNVTYNVDGKDRIFSISIANEGLGPVFCGYVYRRDWIVKYGTNPVTGAAFTGGYTDEGDDSWVDDVVFPSGNTEPIYISDWEWMLEIFAKAIDNLGAEGGYPTSMYYPGFTWSGGLCSSFGGGVPVWYADKDNQVQFGGTSNQFRAYLECLNVWYENGWLDPVFDQRTSDAHYMIDQVNVRQGKVGMWLGVESDLGGRIDIKSEEDPLTDGIFVAGCAYPINDVYGDESCQYVEPDCVNGSGLTGNPFYITQQAVDNGKDIATICSFFDYFYSEEGAVARSIGLNKEQLAEISSTLYADNGIADGAYEVTDEGKYKLNPVITNDGGSLDVAAAAIKLPGMQLIDSIDKGYADTFQASIDSWVKYPNTGFFQGSIVTNNMTYEDAKAADGSRTKILEYMTVNAPDFIKGKKDIHGADWDTWCTVLSKYNYQKATDIFQIYVDRFSFR